MATDYTLDDMTIVIDLIRQKHPGQLLTSAMVTFGFPNVNIPTQQRPNNTVIVATAVPGRRYVGSQSFYYNRVKISDFPNPGLPDQTKFIVTNEKTLHDLLPAINERYRTNLTKDKVYDQPIPDFDAEGLSEAVIELKIAPDSIVYLGSLMLTVTPDLIPLSAIIKQRTMTGLIYAPPA